MAYSSLMKPDSKGTFSHPEAHQPAKLRLNATPIFELTRDSPQCRSRDNYAAAVLSRTTELQRLLKGSNSALGEELLVIAEEFSECRTANVEWIFSPWIAPVLWL
jgi:hypothetical protein